MNPRAWIPNGITLGNMTCGVAGIVAAILGRPDWTIILVLIAAFLDFFDGFFARLLKVDSPLGGELDSLADVVTFGVGPGLAAIGAISLSLPSLHANHWTDLSALHLVAKLAGVIYFGCAAYRLAKFNVDTEQSTEFKGLASPAAGIALGSLVALTDPRSMFFVAELANVISAPWVLSVVTVIIGILMIINTKMFSLKFKDYGLKGNGIKYLFLGLCVASIVGAMLLGQWLIAFPMIIGWYVVLSLVGALKKN